MMRKIIIISLIVLMLSMTCVSAGLLDNLFGGNDTKTPEHTNITLEKQEINGMFNISAPVGSDFVYEKTIGKEHMSFKNNGNYSEEVLYITYTPYEFDSPVQATKLCEKNDTSTVYEAAGGVGLYFVDTTVKGNTVTLTGYDLELLKDMIKTVEFSSNV